MVRKFRLNATNVIGIGKDSQQVHRAVDRKMKSVSGVASSTVRQQSGDSERRNCTLRSLEWRENTGWRSICSWNPWQNSATRCILTEEAHFIVITIHLTQPSHLLEIARNDNDGNIWKWLEIKFLDSACRVFWPTDVDSSGKRLQKRLNISKWYRVLSPNG